MTRYCYTCGIEEGTEHWVIYSCGGPQDMLSISVKYWEDEQYICDLCSATLSDILFYLRHNLSLGTIFRVWKGNKKEREKGDANE